MASGIDVGKVDEADCSARVVLVHGVDGLGELGAALFVDADCDGRTELSGAIFSPYFPSKRAAVCKTELSRDCYRYRVIGPRNCHSASAPRSFVRAMGQAWDLA